MAKPIVQTPANILSATADYPTNPLPWIPSTLRIRLSCKAHTLSSKGYNNNPPSLSVWGGGGGGESLTPQRSVMLMG